VSAHGPRGGVLAIDHGTKRTGFAVVDGLRIVAQPLEAFHGPGSGRELVEHVAALLAERSIEVLLVGSPESAGGGTSGRAGEVRAFADALRARFPAVAVVLYDERLTTKEALDLLREAGFHGEERKRRRDSWSALVLLRDWLASGEPR
jgi:putative Holliday junction resolvase